MVVSLIPIKRCNRRYSQPGKTTTLDIAACESNCPLFKYHQGIVMHHLTVYLIFWLPSGYIVRAEWQQ